MPVSNLVHMIEVLCEACNIIHVKWSEHFAESSYYAFTVYVCVQIVKTEQMSFIET